MILQTMLQRLYASLLRGPSMNARPHNSRQRLDLTRLSDFQGESVNLLLTKLLGDLRKVEFPARVPAFVRPDYPEAEWSEKQRESNAAFNQQLRLLNKFRDIARDAQEYFDDHGEDALFIGFPLISIPPSPGKENTRSSRILAPAAMIPVSLKVRHGARTGITIEATGEGTDLLVPNPALMAWIEQQTGEETDDLFADESGEDPWKEVNEILKLIAKALNIEVDIFAPETPLEPISKADELADRPVIIPGAVMGLFPMTNPGLMRDTKWMMGREKEIEGPVRSFLSQHTLDVPSDTPVDEAVEVALEERASFERTFDEEFLVTNADPCQADAVKYARNTSALVVHGPPGTGKSQTITNVIGDHLARGERVLFVCDKRTALDVVKYRLDALGLGHLCGVIHDPQRDRRNFYMGLRKRLEELVESESPKDPKSKLSKTNERLNALHSELRNYFSLLHAPDEGGLSFHELVGKWLEFRTASKGTSPLETIGEIELSQINTHRADLDEIFNRAKQARLSTNPFFENLAVKLEDTLGVRDAEVEAAFQNVKQVATEVDATAKEGLIELEPGQDLAEQETLRREIAGSLERLGKDNDAEILRRLGELDSIDSWAKELSGFGGEVAQLGEPIDRELQLQIKGTPVPLSKINQSIQALVEYQEAQKSWTKIFAFGKKKDAGEALNLLALNLGDSEVERAVTFYKSLRARWLLSDFIFRLLSQETEFRLLDDESLKSKQHTASAGLQLIEKVENSCSSQRLHPLLKNVFANTQAIPELVEDLRLSADRADRISKFDKAVEKVGLLKNDTIARVSNQLRANEAAGPIAQAWLDHHATIESVLRLERNLGQLASPIREAVRELALRETDLETAYNLLSFTACEQAIIQRIKKLPALLTIDSARVDATFRELLDRMAEKQSLTVQSACFHWESEQRKQLIASNGSRLNTTGASLRQRLYVRGKKALKLRQMIAAGSGQENGDPLFDLCPVWMAGPSTVAQIFPRLPLFDVVIFDEASQCRLEEALPVLLRAKRVVIAGDPKQLPPTRFFESALIETEDTDAETVEELMAQQMSEAEDLLSASLNLDVQEVFLDVHYRSRNEALIGFSNEQFYHDRLQPIPGHPKNKMLNTPIRIRHVGGIYDKRTNKDEAGAVAELVAELLDDRNPPSIGVACFNLTQKDTILEALDAKAEEDKQFAERLEVARKRQGSDSFEGFFVKNLENVQGDERDHIIISATFGPAPDGKFRRNFGALSRIGGERRLNVLVTRAREAVHVLTSIPQTEYRATETFADGARPNGRHFLYYYLRYAERVEEGFNKYQDHIETLKAEENVACEINESKSPSPLAVQLGTLLKGEKSIGSTVHWGNDGFCVDVALTNPRLPEDVTVGVLADFNRYRKTSDPIAWEQFRTLILKSQGWNLHRHWSPTLFRDMDANLQSITNAHEKVVGS